MRRSIIITSLALLATYGIAEAKSIRWWLAERPLELFGGPDEPEADYELRITCLPGKAVEIGVGAYTDLGKGKGEPLAVTLQSGTRSVSLSGASKPSKNFEMTGAHELRARLKPDQQYRDLLAVLTSSAPIKVSGAMRAEWSVRGLQKKAAHFAEYCGGN